MILISFLFDIIQVDLKKKTVPHYFLIIVKVCLTNFLQAKYFPAKQLFLEHLSYEQDYWRHLGDTKERGKNNAVAGL